jgi:hypothetical protein
MSGLGAGGALDAEALHDLAASCPPREAFGPDSERPFLALDLAGARADLANWIRQLPCPVIGVGAGPLAGACDVVLDDAGQLPRLAANIAAAPLAAMVLVQLLRLGEELSEPAALVAESLAYATVQAGPEFRRWQARRPDRASPTVGDGLVLRATREGGRLTLAMNRPQSFNAIGVEMRDALAEAFDLALLDPDILEIELSGRGRCFSVGGDIDEFGLASDPATAHWVRSLRLPATRLPPLRHKLTARPHGAVIGAGVEIAAFAGRIVARPDAWFQLPELKYGLIPGAGGTVSLPRRIGRQRTAYMALSMRRVAAQEALGWGLVDSIER